MCPIWDRHFFTVLTLPAAFERVTPADVLGLRDGAMRYGLLLNDTGGIKDDFMVARLPQRGILYLVVNASTKHADLAYLETRLGDDITIEPQPNRALLALQGPHARAYCRVMRRELLADL